VGLFLWSLLPTLSVTAFSGNGTNFCKAAGFEEADCIADLEAFATKASSLHQPLYHKSMLPYHAWNHAFQNGHSARMFLKRYGGVDLEASLFDEAIALAGFFHDIGYPTVMTFNGYGIKQVCSLFLQASSPPYSRRLGTFHLEGCATLALEHLRLGNQAYFCSDLRLSTWQHQNISSAATLLHKPCACECTPMSMDA
jgi:hypothetical protein